MASDEVYCHYDPVDHDLAIYTRNCDGPGNRHFPEPEEDAEFAAHGAVMTPQQNIVAAVVARLQSWRSATEELRSLSIDAVEEDATRWFTDVCMQLEDHSIHITTLSINANSTLPLGMLLPKIAACEWVLVEFETHLEAMPLQTQNSVMLRQLSKQLCSPRLLNVMLRMENESPELLQQLRVVLQCAADMRINLSLDAFFDSNTYLLTELIAAKPCALRINDLNDTDIPAMMQLVQAVQGSLHTFDVSLSYTTRRSTSIHTVIQSVAAVGHSLMGLPYLRALSLAITYHLPEFTVDSLVDSMVQLGSLLLTMRLTTLHVRLHPVGYAKQADRPTFAIAVVQPAVRTALLKWQPAVLNGSLSIEMLGGGVYSTADTKALSDEVDAQLRSNRSAVQRVVEQLIMARSINEMQIGLKVLQYVHECFTSSA